MYIYAGTLLDAASALSKEQDDTELMPTLKINWKSKKADSDNGGYNQELLESIFSKYGPLHHVLVSTKRKGKALVSFQHPFDAVSVEKYKGGSQCSISALACNARVLPHCLHVAKSTGERERLEHQSTDLVLGVRRSHH